MEPTVDRQAEPESLSTPPEARPSRPWLARHPELWVALILMVASSLFVTTFANLARWQFGYKYHKTVDLCNWDCSWFRSVVDEGYDKTPWRFGDKANWGFLPLFPLSAVPLKHLRMTTTAIALVYAGRFEMYAGVVFFMMLLRDRLRNLSEYFMAGALVAFNPYLIYGHAGYSEPLYFALASMAFFLLAEKRWVESGVAAGLLSAVRIVGCLFAVSYFIFCVRKLGLSRLLREHTVSVLLGLLLCPIGLATYMLFLYHRGGDALGFLHIQLAWHRAAGNPFVVITHALSQGSWQRVWASMSIVGLAAVAWLVKQRRPDMAVYLGGAILVPLTADTWGFARYLWWQPPFLYVVFALLQRHRWLWIIYFAFAAGMASFMVIEWFSGTNMVI
jgi:hypothetical protein